MPHLFRRIAPLCLALFMLAGLPATAQPRPAGGPGQAFLPLVFGPVPPPNPFGFDLRSNSKPEALQYAQKASPKWTRAGDVVWADIEPVRGGGYRWEALAAVDANVQRLRAAGIEPTLIVQQTPSWAQRVPGRRCSPMRPEYIGDFARFLQALVTRYSGGASEVRYWEIWNEPDFRPGWVTDAQGVGCWADPALPYNGGAYYGQVLKQVYPAIKSANPGAVVVGGALAYFWPDDTASRQFLSGILASGAGNSLDALSFHAYGEWGAGDLLINKTARIRQVLGSYGLATKPLIATEIAATCYSDTNCPPDFLQRQANYAARIYAEAIALDLKGAFWYTLANGMPGFASSHLIDDQNGGLTPRPAYYAFLNSALLLQGVRYAGPPVQEPGPDQIDKVQVLVFQKPRSTLYVLWVPQTPDGFPKPYRLAVTPGATALCTDRLDRPPDLPYEQGGRAVYYCSDTNRDGVIPRAVGELPMYVEVFR